MAFCDFCDCDDCRDGGHGRCHAKTADGSTICDVCYQYDLCTSGPDRNPRGPCVDEDCRHRPRIVSEWTQADRD